MRTTVTIDDELLTKAMKYTGLKEKSAVIRAALTALVQREAARRLARLGGTQPQLECLLGGVVILVDTSVWVDHLNVTDDSLTRVGGRPSPRSSVCDW